MDFSSDIFLMVLRDKEAGFKILSRFWKISYFQEHLQKDTLKKKLK